MVECNTQRMYARVPNIKPANFYNALSRRAGKRLIELRPDGSKVPISVRQLLDGPEVLVWVAPPFTPP